MKLNCEKKTVRASASSERDFSKCDSVRAVLFALEWKMLGCKVRRKQNGESRLGAGSLACSWKTKDLETEQPQKKKTISGAERRGRGLPRETGALLGGPLCLLFFLLFCFFVLFSLHLEKKHLWCHHENRVCKFKKKKNNKKIWQRST